jgi:hypothetical protein
MFSPPYFPTVLLPAWPRNVRELAQLMSDHVLGHIDRNVTAAVMDSDGVADKGREDRGGTAPGLDDLLLAGLVHFIDPLQQLGSGKRAFLNTSAHYLFPPYFALRRLTMNLSVAFFFLRVL